ncbi:MAG: DUF1499 domain-containing protein [Pseudanabaenales cyanobacterium]|nr:DUF1499 domain-containing protein [Pseudanabaenales cyanobacterium]
MPSSFLSLLLSTLLATSFWLGTGFPSLAQGFQNPAIATLPGLAGLFAGERPTNLGVKQGQLAPCPTTPNCVASQETDAEHAIAPLNYDSEPAIAMSNLVAVIKGMPRSVIIEQTDDYLYAEFTSRLMGFVDDVEFYIDPTNRVIQVRSSARLGESDLGVNRKRIESIRSGLQTLAETA